jgi:hypothetical protein
VPGSSLYFCLIDVFLCNVLAIVCCCMFLNCVFLPAGCPVQFGQVLHWWRFVICVFCVLFRCTFRLSVPIFACCLDVYFSDCSTSLHAV